VAVEQMLMSFPAFTTGHRFTSIIDFAPAALQDKSFQPPLAYICTQSSSPDWLGSPGAQLVYTTGAWSYQTKVPSVISSLSPIHTTPFSPMAFKEDMIQLFSAWDSTETRLAPNVRAYAWA